MSSTALQEPSHETAIARAPRNEVVDLTAGDDYLDPAEDPLQPHMGFLLAQRRWRARDGERRSLTATGHRIDLPYGAFPGSSASSHGTIAHLAVREHRLSEHGSPDGPLSVYGDEPIRSLSARDASLPPVSTETQLRVVLHDREWVRLLLLAISAQQESTALATSTLSGRPIPHACSDVPGTATRHHSRPGRPVLICLGSTELQVMLDSRGALEPPFIEDTVPGLWSVTREMEVLLSLQPATALTTEFLADREIRGCLVSVARTLEHHVLIDLGVAGVTSIEAPAPILADHILSQIVEEALQVFQPGCGEVLLVGCEGDRSRDDHCLVRLGSVEEVLSHLGLIGYPPRAPLLGGDGAVEKSGVPWLLSDVVVAIGSSGVRTADPALEILAAWAQDPRSGLGVVLGSPHPTACYAIRATVVDGVIDKAILVGDQVVLGPFNPRHDLLVARPITSSTVSDVVARSVDPAPKGAKDPDRDPLPIPRPALIPAALANHEAESTGASRASTRVAACGSPGLAGTPPGVEVRLLGPVQVVGAARPLLHSPRLTELILYLVLHPDGSTTDSWSAALWPDRRVPLQTLANRLSEARKALGVGADGRPRLERRGGRFYLTSEVSSDWAAFTALVKQGTNPEQWEEALRLVRGRPFEGVGQSYWTVLEGITSSIESEIAETALRLGEYLLTSGRISSAEWAARQGLRACPFDERLYRLAMRASDAAGNRCGVEHLLAELGRVLEAAGDPLDAVHPSTATLYESLMNHDRLSSSQASARHF